MGSRSREGRRERAFKAEQAEKQFEREAETIRGTGQEAQRQYQNVMQDFEEATSGTPQAVSRLQQLIRERALPEQQKALAQGRIARQQQGVRGIDAAVLEQQQSNALQRQLAQQAEQVALEQQLRDREARQSLAAQKATQAFIKGFGAGVPAAGSLPSQVAQNRSDQIRLRKFRESQRRSL